MIVEAERKIGSSDQKAKLEGAISAMKKLFSRMHLDATNSEVLIKMDIEDQFAQTVKMILQDPVGQMYNGVRAMNTEFSELRHMIISSVFSLTAIKDLINEVYVENNDFQPLTYHIWLKNNNLENRSKVRKTLRSIIDDDIAEVFPTVIHFIDDETHQELKKEYSNSKVFFKFES